MKCDILFRCADIQQGLIKDGRYEKYKASRLIEGLNDVSVLCPKGIVTKPEDIAFVINKLGQFQLVDSNHDVDNDHDGEPGAQRQL